MTTNRIPAGINVGTYSKYEQLETPSRGDFTGYVSPEGPRAGWIVYTRADGSAQLYERRGPSGAVLGAPRELSARTLESQPSETETQAALDQVLSHFRHAHLPPHLAVVSAPLAGIARTIADYSEINSTLATRLVDELRSLGPELCQHPETAEGLHQLADVLDGFDHAAAVNIRALAGPRPVTSPLVDLLRALLVVKDHAVRGAVALTKTA